MNALVKSAKKRFPKAILRQGKCRQLPHTTAEVLYYAPSKIKGSPSDSLPENLHKKGLTFIKSQAFFNIIKKWCSSEAASLSHILELKNSIETWQRPEQLRGLLAVCQDPFDLKSAHKLHDDIHRLSGVL